MPRRRVHQSRWDIVMGLTAKALNRSLQMACRRRHNYIIDQTNVSKEGRRKRLTQFADFQRKCVVMIPPDDELERRLLRQARQDSSGQCPAEAMLELKGALVAYMMKNHGGGRGGQNLQKKFQRKNKEFFWKNCVKNSYFINIWILRFFFSYFSHKVCFSENFYLIFSTFNCRSLFFCRFLFDSLYGDGADRGRAIR